MYVIYNEETGKVRSLLITQEERILNSMLLQGENWIETSEEYSEVDPSCFIVEDGELKIVDIESEKNAVINMINRLTSVERSYWVSNIVGQDSIYLKKEQEAKDYMALLDNDVEPNLDHFPLMKSEVGVTADTGYEIAQIWLNMSFLWTTVSAEMERVRLTANQTVTSATQLGELEDIYNDFHNNIVALRNR